MGSRRLSARAPTAGNGSGVLRLFRQRLRNAMGPHVVSLLKAGMSVVLDFPANTLASRSWMRRIFEDANAANELHSLDVSDETCKRRLRERNSAGEHPFQPSESDYEI